jgi:uncharacterized protein (DUF1800 family)
MAHNARMMVLTGLAGLCLAGPAQAQPAPAPAAAVPAAVVPAAALDAKTGTHVLNRMGFGPRPGDVERLQARGLAAHVDEQLHPERLADPALEGRLAGLTTLSKSLEQLARDHFNDESEPDRRRRGPITQQPSLELAQQKVLRALQSPAQLQEVMVDFWFNHFNVNADKGPVRIQVVPFERDVIRPRAMGKFRDLLGAVAKSPAMLFYLDNFLSSGPDPRSKKGLNENYGRELLELHTLGVNGGYTQKDVQEVARVLTGWSLDRPREGGGFRYKPRLHDAGDKVVLGQRIAGRRGPGGVAEGEELLDRLARHPSTARFIAEKLARRFVSDDPPTALVSRLADTFKREDGDIRAVLRVLLLSPEMLDPARKKSYRAKVKTPFEFVVSALRRSGANVSDALPLVRRLGQLGMPLYHCAPPTGYADRASAWVSSGALLARMNLAIALARGKLPGTRPTLTQPPLTEVEAWLGGDLSPATRDVLGRAAQPWQRVALALGSPEFQRR